MSDMARMGQKDEGLPAGYRWATPAELDAYLDGRFDVLGSVWVASEDSLAVPNTEGQAHLRPGPLVEARDETPGCWVALQSYRSDDGGPAGGDVHLFRTKDAALTYAEEQTTAYEDPRYPRPWQHRGDTWTLEDDDSYSETWSVLFRPIKES